MAKVLAIVSAAVICLVVVNNINCHQLIDLVSDLSDEDADELELDGFRVCTTDWYVNHLKLTLQWAPGACKSGDIKCEVRPKQEFLIHGLWPQKEGNRFPSFCCSQEQFDVRALRSDSYNRMIEVWPSLTSAPNHVFWNHEWQKHGTCAKKVGLNNFREYFDFALKKFKQLDINATMKKHGLKPTNNAYYNEDDLINILSYNHGRSISYNCRYLGNAPILTEVYYCYDTKLNPIDCQPPPASCRRVKILE